MQELRTRKRQMRGDVTNHHEKLELKTIWCGIQCTFPNTAGTSLDLACINTNTWFSQPNQGSHTPDFSYPLVSCASFSSSSPSLYFSSTTGPSSHNTKSSHPSISRHAKILSWHQVQHTQSTAYTKYSVHWVQYPRKIVCFTLILKITSWPLSVAVVSGVPPYPMGCHQPAFHERSKVRLPCYIPTVAS
jgi:hypothetical protein